MATTESTNEIKQEDKHELIDEEEGDDGDMAIFDIMHDAVDALSERFQMFIDNPTPEEHKKFDDLVKEFISLARDLKNLSKSVLPPQEKPKKEPKKKTAEPPTQPTQQVEQPVINPVSEESTKKKGRRAAPNKSK